MADLHERIKSKITALDYEGKSRSAGGGLVEGCVERIGKEDGRGYICGWVIDRSQVPISLKIVDAEGQSHDVETMWFEREDIAAQYGKDHLQSGFVALLPTVPRSEGGDNGPAKKGFRLLANGHVLRFVPVANVKSHGQHVIDAKLKNPIKGLIEKIDGLTIRGWAVLGTEAPKALAVRLEDSIFEVAVRWQERKDVADALNLETLHVGFEIDLPGYLWEGIPEEQALSIEILGDGHTISAEPVKLTRESIVHWLEETAALSEGPEQQYRTLVALEHLRFGSGFAPLSPEIRLFVRESARKLNLLDYLPKEEGENAEETSGESFVTLLHWKALRILNERLVGVHASEDVFRAVVAVISETGLEGEVRERYLDSVVPTLCKYDMYGRLQEVTDLRRWLRYGQSENAWSLTVALPAKVQLGHFRQATDLLWKVTGHIDSGWLNTECIHYTVRELSRRVRSGEVPFDVAEKYRYAVIGLFDAFRGEWFSRLHDLELVQAAVALLEDWSGYPDYFRRDVITALIRNYGLSPSFWQVLGERHPDFRDPESDRAHAHWQAIRKVLENGTVLHERLAELDGHLRYFRRMGNPEAVIVLREVVMNALPMLNRELAPGAKSLIDTLLEDPAEGVRIAAFPLAGRNRLQDEFPECGEQLASNLRALTPRPTSMFYEAQSEAGRLVREIVDAKRRGAGEEFSAAVEALHAHAANLNDWHSGHLGIDLLTLLYECHFESQGPRDSVLLTLSQSINNVIAETDENWFLPVPVQSALARLNGVKGENPLLRTLLADMRRTIQQKFGDKHEALFERSEAPAFAMPAGGFPRDTLVVIYSCRKYLDTRIEATRRTWVDDLKARGIPYLIMVGDGDDAVHGDVLALDVSDKYEDLPKKTLKLIDWVLDNTDFQYLYKIDDDCYLNVDRFFGTLTYRKHFYYGRIIERRVGSMDRAWHQPKSHTVHAQKVLDKSPEPSSYADGGGGYSISRLAMQEVRKARQSEAGQRLLSVSVMEDKLVGDLLALSGIHPSNEDYESYQRRRTFGAAVPVGMWENTFYPSAATPTVMTHLDTDKGLEQVRQIGQGSEIWPKKLWTTASLPLVDTWSPSGALGPNHLELLVDAKQLQELLVEPLHVVAVVRNEMTLLPHFLDHYRKLGVRSFLVVDNLSDDGSREYLLDQPDVALFSADTEYKFSQYGVAWQQAIVGNLCLGKWALLADADELLVYPDCEHKPLADFIAEVEIEGADCVRTDMIDMYPFNDLDEADFKRSAPFEVAAWFDREPLRPWRLGSGWYSNNAISFSSTLRHRIDATAEPHAFVSQKFALFRYQPCLRVSRGLHYMTGGRLSKQRAYFAHFKYHSGFKDKVETEIRRGQHFDNAKEYRRYAAMLVESRGQFGDETLSVKYENSSSFAVLNGPEEK